MGISGSISRPPAPLWEILNKKYLLF